MINSNAKNMKFIVAGLLLGILMSAMDNTIVTTAMGTIVNKLGGLDQFVWVTSAYMVTVMAGTPIFGKLSDMYGRKRFFIFGLIIFLLGSILCGTAQSITQLSIYRAIQGIGGGALMPIAFTIIFDIFPAEKRGKATGLFGAVFGMSSIFGPLLGAFITESFGWNWVFYINIPLGIVALILISVFYKESLSHAKQKIDWGGAATLVGAVICLMFALELGGKKYAWDSTTILTLFAGFTILFVLFLMIERKVSEPIISFEMFRTRLFATSNLVALMYGSVFIVATVYIPIFVQGVYGGSATNSGLILMPMMIGSVVGSQTGGFLTTKTSFRNIMMISVSSLLLGIVLLSSMTQDTPKSLLTLYSIFTGFGVGFSFSVLSMAAIHHFDYRKRGAATSTNSFLRSLGMTLGITIFGIIQRNTFSDQIKQSFGNSSEGGPTFSNPQQALDPENRKLIPEPVLQKITAALSTSIAHSFMWALIPVAFAVIFVFLMPKDRLKLHAKKSSTPVEPSQG
ncbi:EmrB/QacA subfamily drug resistance transporter [Paenibacillus shirakamiensis]|uniref:EmrB/QacA subfamily drug resistance transporter n=1 Tax=Paenibacillus shirakamiensis TaxID=1265935 RepID=A0ABS4JFM1_9BACL|nr:MDR family MFS transporter [Paenibacillus shirakamiensis]MBP2000520.1 EmrB/QacA subfamily drug resistance transporter [Paenibacillus shirakamiensis]